MFLEQRMLHKKLIIMRKELNKNLKEKFPNATFYFSIYKGKIVKRNKYILAREKCAEEINKMMRDALNESNPKQTINTSSSHVNAKSLANENDAQKAVDINYKQIRKIADDIASHAIKTINNHQYWSENDNLVDLSFYTASRCLSKL